ncbi:MAG: histidine--tRNA ligase [bacterium]|nr:histidine--tRNA ligase [bacterium]
MNKDSNNQNPISTEPYKGVRDFYPEDMTVQNYIFDIWRKSAKKFGYEEYSASILEPAELYRAKSGEEIVNEQTYTFTDRGDREVTLRPEMTPTLARMISAKRKSLTFPIRWFSMPNLFRYEQPQRGRVREHFQFNADIFGIASTDAEIEIISLANETVLSYGLKPKDFEILINSRKLMDFITRDVLSLDSDKSHKLSKLIDRKNKLPADVFEMGIKEIIGDKADAFLTLLNSQNFEEFTNSLQKTSGEQDGIREIKEVIKGLEDLGITNVRFDQTLMRGFDYYTGVVFEVFDTDPKNRRALFGGGRYDDLLAIFDGEKIPAVGFGSGDVTARDIMEIRDLLPKNSKSADVYICPTDIPYKPFANDLAQIVRNSGFSASVDYTTKKIGDKIKYADKKNIPLVIVVGENEKNSGKFSIKKLSSGESVETDADNLVKILREIIK